MVIARMVPVRSYLKELEHAFLLVLFSHDRHDRPMYKGQLNQKDMV